MGLVIFGVLVSQIFFIINIIFVLFFVLGLVLWMYYVDCLMEFFFGVLGVVFGIILLLLLLKSFVSGNYDEYCWLMDWGLCFCFLLVLLSVVVLGIFVKLLIVVLFQYGKFSVFDVVMIQCVLVVYFVGLMGFIVVKVLVLGFYFCQDIKILVKIVIIILIMIQVMNLVFIGLLKYVGLLLFIGLVVCLNVVLFYWQLCKQKIFILQLGWLVFLLCLIIVVLVMVVVLLGVMYFMFEWLLGMMLFCLMCLLVVVIVGVVVYFVMLLVLGFCVKEFVCCMV